MRAWPTKLGPAGKCPWKVWGLGRYGQASWAHQVENPGSPWKVQGLGRHLRVAGKSPQKGKGEEGVVSQAGVTLKGEAHPTRPRPGLSLNRNHAPRPTSMCPHLHPYSQTVTQPWTPRPHGAPPNATEEPKPLSSAT